ncbi:MAG TPA: hypothetical protein VGG28_01810 [Kofleriaceae bacterium]|jgi:hypothetical protein
MRYFALVILAACKAAAFDPSSSATTDASAADAGATTADAQPAPAPGSGVDDPPSETIHDHSCAGSGTVDWQLLDNWVINPHLAPALAPAGQLDACVARYAGWVTNAADAAGVSRASVYAALAAAGECDHDYDGLMISGALCATANSGVDTNACAAQMASSVEFGVGSIARALASTKTHQSDPPLMAAFLSSGKVACGGGDRWNLVAAAGYVDAYVAAYNSYNPRQPPSCTKRIVVTTALYTGMGNPGEAGVAESNGCWTYERVSKDNVEWKICNYDGTVNHPDGVKWAYDDTNTLNDATTEQTRITACQTGAPGRGYIYMANRGAGWRQTATANVRAHFAELYSSQTTVDDQDSTWTADSTPGSPMLNFGEAATTAAEIKAAAAQACGQVGNNGFLGVYVYPTSLDGDRLTALVQALNACTGS